MQPHALLALMGLGLLLLTAAVIDCRARRIPNRLVMLGAVSALAWHLLLPPGLHPATPLSPGSAGLLEGLLAAGLTLPLGLLLWRGGLCGAGDAKWLTVLAGHAGPSLLPPFLLATALAAGALSLVWLVAGRRDPMPVAVALAAGQFGLMAWLALPPAALAVLHPW